MSVQISVLEPMAAVEPVSPLLRGVLTTWRRLACGRFAPTRAELSLAEFAGVIGNIFVLDVVDDGQDVRFRFGGEAIVRFMGGRHNGRLLSQMRGAPFYDSMHAMVSQSIKTRLPLTRGPFRSSREGKNHVEIEVLFVPVCDDGCNIIALYAAVDFAPC